MTNAAQDVVCGSRDRPATVACGDWQEEWQKAAADADEIEITPAILDAVRHWNALGFSGEDWGEAIEIVRMWEATDCDPGTVVLALAEFFLRRT